MYMGCHKCHFMAWLPLSCIVFIIVLLLIWFYCCKLYEYEYMNMNATTAPDDFIRVKKDEFSAVARMRSTIGN